MTIQQIGYFIRLSEELNYARVAKEFYITQPTLSRQIINLENELKINLFDRDRNSVALTDEGRFFYENIKPVFHSMLDIIHETQNLKGNDRRITIGIQDDQLISNDLMLSISRFRYDHPDINIALHKADPDELLEKLGTGEFDLVNLAMIPTFRQNDPYDFFLLESEPICLIYSAKMPDLGPSMTKEALYEFLENHKLIMPVLHRSANDEQAGKYFAINMPSLDAGKVLTHLSQSGRAISLPIQISSQLGVSLSSRSTLYSIDPQLRVTEVEGTEGTYQKGILFRANTKNTAAKALVALIKDMSEAKL